MGKRTSINLETVENNRILSKDTDCAFLDALERGLLLALKESGRLNEMQYRIAEEKLTQQKMQRKKRSI